MDNSTGTWGLRHNPQCFIDGNRSLQGALVRTFALEAPGEGDAAILQAEIDGVLAEQRDDGSFGGNAKHTGSQLLSVLELGLDPGVDAVIRAADAILRQARAGDIDNEWYEHDGEVLSIYALHALCWLDCREPEVTRSLRLFVERQEEWNDPWQGCPWTPEVFWSALWAGRHIHPPVVDAVGAGMRRMADNMNEAGCCGYNDPWGLTQAAGQIDLAEARDIVAKQIPMILRGQRSDGGWGDRSHHVFRTLYSHGLMESLRRRAPLPAELAGLAIRSLSGGHVVLPGLGWGQSVECGSRYVRSRGPVAAGRARGEAAQDRQLRIRGMVGRLPGSGWRRPQGAQACGRRFGGGS